MRSGTFLLVAVLVAAAVFVATVATNNQYYLFAGYVVLQYVVLATAWNILGGYCGYVNFGSAAFYAVGAYSTVALHELGAHPDRYLAGTPFEFLGALLPLSLPSLIVIGGAIAGIVGLGMGYLTLRLRGVFFAIATLALAVVLQTIVVNWDYVGGARGSYIIAPHRVSLGSVSMTYIQYLFLAMLLLSLLALLIARLIERSRIGLGFATIRDDEAAAEASGVPTLRLKVFATTLSGALMGMAGAPFPYYVGYVEPLAAFDLTIAVNSIAMPMIGGTTSWVGPLVGAILLGALQQIATVTISSEMNLLVVGVMLVAFVIAAPLGIVGLVKEFLRQAAPHRLDWRSVSLVALAGYCFLSGVLAAIFSLPQLQSGAGWLAIFGMIVGGLYVVSAYGLMKLQRWAPVVTILALVMSVAWIGTVMQLATSRQGIVTASVAIVLALAGIALLLNRKARVLYNPPPGTEPGRNAVPA